MFRFQGIFDIVSSDLCLILSNLRAVQCASQSVEKKSPNVKTKEFREYKALTFASYDSLIPTAKLIFGASGDCIKSRPRLKKIVLLHRFRD